MKVQRIVRPYSGRISWIVLDDGFSPVESIQDFLLNLNNIERSPNTVRAYAYHLKLFWEYIQAGKLDWRTVGFQESADFIGWLRDPQSIEAMPIYERVSKRTESTINAILAADAESDCGIKQEQFRDLRINRQPVTIGDGADGLY